MIDIKTLKTLTNFDSKGSKISVNDWAAISGKASFKNISFSITSRPPKIRSLHTYGVLWIYLCVANCKFDKS